MINLALVDATTLQDAGPSALLLVAVVHIYRRLQESQKKRSEEMRQKLDTQEKRIDEQQAEIRGCDRERGALLVMMADLKGVSLKEVKEQLELIINNTK